MKPSFLTLLFLPALVISSFAGSATWSANPMSDDWNTAANWTPATVPDGPEDIATFGVSNQPNVTLSTTPIELNELDFAAGASPYVITATKGWPFTLSGAGIIN